MFRFASGRVYNDPAILARGERDFTRNISCIITSTLPIPYRSYQISYRLIRPKP